MSELEDIEAMVAPLSLGVMHKSGQRVYDNARLYEAIQAHTDRVAKEAVIGEREHIMAILGNACELSMKLNGNDATIKLSTLKQLLADYVAPEALSEEGK